MVTKRIRSEYMKKFKDPKWETYSKCYEEMLRYRLGRRLLEHSHNAWFWSGSDSDSESGGRSPPASGGEKVQCERGRGRTKAGVEEREDQQQKQQQQQDQQQKKQQQKQDHQQKKQQQQDQQQQPPSCVPRLPLLQEENGSAGHDSHPDGEARATEEKEEQRSGSRTREQDPVVETEPGGPRPPQSKPPKHSKQTRRLQRVKPSPSPHPKEDSMDGKHPFALYGSGEKQADIADKKTHNVCPVASTNEIHESALRAKTRREAERQIQTQRSERRRAKSANLDRARKLSQPEFNPWLTEYMRCFSSRSR